jgi:hypothetical protein
MKLAGSRLNRPRAEGTVAKNTEMGMTGCARGSECRTSLAQAVLKEVAPHHDGFA